MDDFKAICRILKALDADLDLDEPAPEAYSAERLGITGNRRDNLLWMMRREDYADGVTREEYYDGASHVDASGIRVTIKGLEYLHDNSMTAKAARAAKGIAEVVLTGWTTSQNDSAPKHPDYYMAQSMQRLIDTGDPLPHDLVLFKLGAMEARYMAEGMTQGQAHGKANELYNYQKMLKEWIDGEGVA